MYMNDARRLLYNFIMIFIVLLAILVILPYIVDRVADLLSRGMKPGSNSIIVFKDLVEEQAVMGRFITILKKIIIFM